MTAIAFTPSPLAFAENSALAVLRSCVVKGLTHWNFPLNNRAALEELAKRGLVSMELASNGRSYQVTLTPAGKSKLGI